MLYYFERTKVAVYGSYVTISIRDDGEKERTFVFDETSDFSDTEKNKLCAVVPIDGFVSRTTDYELCNFTYDSIGTHILIRRKEK